MSEKFNIKMINEKLYDKKYELIDKLTEGANSIQREYIKKDIIDKITKNLFEEMFSILSSGNEIRIKNFGTFNHGKVSSRITKHPRTGENITIKSTKVIRFKHCKKLKNAINSTVECDTNE